MSEEAKEKGYTSKWVRTSKAKELFEVEGQKVRIAADAKDLVNEYLDKAVEKAVKELIDLLPRKIKGDKKGELKRITLQKSDFEGKSEDKE
jgi:hypothetical protein